MPKRAVLLESLRHPKLSVSVEAPTNDSDHIDRTANISSTQTMPVTIRVLPLGYARFITVDIGFKNPALDPQS